MKAFDLSNQSALDLVVSELINAAKSGQLTVWVGAGISYSPPASLPLAGQIVRGCCRAIASELSIPLDVLLTHQGDVMRLEPFLRLIEVVCSFQDIERFLEFLRDGRPNHNHLALANLLTRYAGCAVISLNFDYLIEEALQDYLDVKSKVIVPAGLGEEYVCPLLVEEEVTPVKRKELTDAIIKPHGTLIKNTGTRGIVATIQALGSGIPQILQKRIRDLINDRILLVVGYSDDDLDLFPLLQSTYPRAVYWNTLSSDLPPKVVKWLSQLDKSTTTTHLVNKCEYLFSAFPNKSSKLMSASSPLDIDEYAKQWVKELNSVVKIATIAAWLAQDRHRVTYAKELYNLALHQEECKRDVSLCRFIRYRYAELLRHQAEEKTSAFLQYSCILGFSFHSPVDLPLIISTIRSLAAALRSLSHKSHHILTLVYSIVAITFLIATLVLTRITPDQQWNSSRFRREKGGTWLPWEFGMVMLGLAQKLWWPRPIKRFLLNRALRMFETSEKSADIYERSAAVFSQARTIGMMARIENKIGRDRMYFLLNQATELFVLLDDVTGLKNIDQLQRAFENGSSDPWLGSS